jgi:hypothetical protein
LVRARMPMKLGMKTVEAKTVATIARYMRVSPMAHASECGAIAQSGVVGGGHQRGRR